MASSTDILPVGQTDIFGVFFNNLTALFRLAGFGLRHFWVRHG